jgi:transposase
VRELGAEEHSIILATIKRGTNAREICRANALNMRDKGLSVMEIADFLEITPRTVINICMRYEADGVERALKDESRPGRPPEYDARVEMKIVATVCSDPPEGFDRWTLELLKERLEDSGVVRSIGKEKIRIVLREHDLKPWLQRMWCVPKLDEEYIARMEDVLDVYERAYNPQFPVVCFDEKPAVLHGDVRRSIPMKEGQPRRVDYEYKRCGTANIFCAVEPKAGRYFNKATANRAHGEFAVYLQELSQHYPEAKRITLVMDNLSTHKEASLINFLGEKRGKEIWSRFDVHYTPKHGSWLNQAEIAISMLQRQCLGSCRIPDLPTLEKKTERWNKAINSKKVIIKWNFFKDDAREKFDYR